MEDDELPPRALGTQRGRQSRATFSILTGEIPLHPEPVACPLVELAHGNLLDASDAPVNYVAMLTATVISVVLALLLTRITRPLWVKGGLEMPTIARSIATLPLLLGGYAAII